MSDEPEDAEVVDAQPAAVVPFEEPEPSAKPVPATSVLRLPMGRKGPQLMTIDDALKYATACHRSGLLPEHIKTPQQAYVIMDNGRELGLGPWASWKLIYITRQGRIAIMSKGALAIVQASAAFEGYAERIEYEGTEEMTAVAIAKRKGRPPIEKRFGLADAKAADLLSKKKSRSGAEYDGPWQSYVKDMLLARARDRALSVAFAAELAGIEPETIAEDADMLDARSAGVPAATPVGIPREPENGALTAEAPKQLPAPKPDPLLAFVLKGPVTRPAVIETPKKSEGAESAPGSSTGAAADSAPVLKAAIEKSIDEALGPPAPVIPRGTKERTPKKREGKPVSKAGDLMHPEDPKLVRRILEVDEDGRPTLVEKLTAQEIDELYKKRSVPDPRKPPYPAHIDDGVWYCDLHGAYGCNPCATAATADPTPSPSGQSSKRCPRENCGAPLNLLGDCDACGWPRT